MAVTIKQIAEAAGVSRGTVDRALNNRGRIRPEVAERIRQLADEMGYRPNQLGRALSMSKNNIKIGVIIQPAKTPFMQEVLRGIDRAVGEIDSLGGTVLLRAFPEIGEKETLRAMEELEAEGIGGLAMVPLEADSVKRKMDELVDHGIPVLTFNSDVEGTKRLCYIGQNGFRCGQAAAGLLGELVGRTGEIALISGYKTNPVLNSRVKGFLSEMEKKFPDITVAGPEYCYEDNFLAGQLTEKLLDQCPDLKGIYITSHGEEGVCSILQQKQLAGTVKMVANDFMGRNYELVREGDIQFLIGQDGQLQGYEPLMTMYRLLFNGEAPAAEKMYTDIYIHSEYTLPEQGK